MQGGLLGLLHLALPVLVPEDGLHEIGLLQRVFIAHGAPRTGLRAVVSQMRAPQEGC
jgi:hypothetical protein